MDRKDANGLFDYLKREIPSQIESDWYEPSKDIEYQHSFLRAVFDANYKQQLEKATEKHGVREEE